MGGGGPSSTTQTVEYKLTPEQEQMIALAVPWAEQFAEQGLSVPQESFVAPFNPVQEQAQQMALDTATQAQLPVATQAAAQNMQLVQDARDPLSNQHLVNAIQAAQQPVWDELYQTALPQVRDEAVATGQYGSSRQGIAEGIAIADAAQKAQGEASKILSDAYNTGMDIAVKSLGITPSLTENLLTPAQTVASVGDVQRALQQAILEEQLGKITQEQLLPATVARELVTLASGMPGGGSFSSGPAASVSPAMQLLGGLSVLSGATGFFGSGGYGGGGGGGSFLPFLFL